MARHSIVLSAIVSRETDPEKYREKGERIKRRWRFLEEDEKKLQEEVMNECGGKFMNLFQGRGQVVIFAQLVWRVGRGTVSPRGEGSRSSTPAVARAAAGRKKGGGGILFSLGSQRDVVYLGWSIAPNSVYDPNAGGGGGASANEYSCVQGAQINFEDPTLYLTWGMCFLFCRNFRKNCSEVAL